MGRLWSGSFSLLVSRDPYGKLPILRLVDGTFYCAAQLTPNYANN